jgi:hypothetical protein
MLTGKLDKGSLTILTFIWSIHIYSYQDFLDRGLLLTRKLLNKRFLLVMLKILCLPPMLG